MGLVLPKCNAHPYLPLTNLGETVRVIHGKVPHLCAASPPAFLKPVLLSESL